MTSFTGRRGHGMYPNLTNLNVIPSEYDLALQQQHVQQPPPKPHQEGYNMTSDLDLFTNAQFFDFEMAEVPTQSPTTFHETDPFTIQHGMNYFDDYQNVYSYPGKSNAGNTLVHRHGQGHHTPTHPTLPIQTPPIQPPHPQQHQSQHPSTVSSPVSSTPTPLDKRKFDTLIDASAGEGHEHEEAARVAAEEDKRRRNTAASARFRVKKKQREAALEKSAKDMSDRVTYLENRVTQLEMENKLLKDLITEKSGKEVAFAELARDLEGADPVEVEKLMVKKGVGTEKAGVKAEA